ncbi:glycosyltransferase family 39 protein [Candidatus Sumerlaeota bacterium]|nr:glycosyltransferase family 39 protein [Candidatus Sumerlaeota bacterium]
MIAGDPAEAAQEEVVPQRPGRDRSLCPLPWDDWLRRHRATWLTLGLLLAFGMRLHLLPFHWVSAADQGRYLAQAENIRRGNWTWSSEYDIVGANTAGLTQFNPPLYPVVTGLVGLATGEVEIAGTVVSMAAGLLIVITAGLLATCLAGPTAGLLASLAVALHPLLINFSANRYSDITFLSLLLGALAVLTCCFDRPTRHHLITAGVLWGLASLTRTEGVILFAIAVIFSLFTLRVRSASWLLLGFLSVTSPLWIWGEMATPPPGQVLNAHQMLAIHRMLGTEISPEERARPNHPVYDVPIAALDERGQITTLEAARETSGLTYLWRERRFFTWLALGNLRLLPGVLTGDALRGGLWVWALLGIAALLWCHGVRHPTTLMLAVMLAPLGYMLIGQVATRYLLTTVTLSCITAAIGLTAVACVCHQALSQSLRSPRVAHVTGGITLALIAVGAGLLALRHIPIGDVRSMALPWRRTLVFAEILRTLPETPRTVASRDAAFGYAVGTRQVIFPYADLPQTLGFLRREGAEYLMTDRPSISRWRPLQESLNHPEQVAGDLEWIARDPEGWYDLYRIRPERVSAEVIPAPVALDRYISAAEQLGDPEFMMGEVRLLPRPMRQSRIESHLLEAQSLMEEGDPDTALTTLQDALRMDPQSLPVLEALGELASAEGRDDLIRSAWINAVALPDEAADPALWERAYTALASLDLSLRDALSEADADAWQAHRVAQWLYREGHTEEALELWEYALSQEEHEELLFGKHRCLMRLNQPSGALEAAEAARARAPHHGWAHLYVGDALRALGRVEEARAAWEACLESEIDAGSHTAAAERLSTTAPAQP